MDVSKCTVRIASKELQLKKNDVDRITDLPLAMFLTEQVIWCILLLGALSKTNRSDIMDLHRGLGLLKSSVAYKPLSISMFLQRLHFVAQCNFITLEYRDNNSLSHCLYYIWTGERAYLL